MQYFGYVYFNSFLIVILLLTRLFKASLDPLREPAQVTVTVQRVGAKSPRHTQTHSYMCYPQHLHPRHTSRYMGLYLQVGQRGEVVESSFWYG